MKAPCSEPSAQAVDRDEAASSDVVFKKLAETNDESPNAIY